MPAKAQKPPDPYRLFFPLGLIIGLAGVLIWPLTYLGLLEGYWGQSHAFLQSDGFLFCFIAGFLLTALPRFTGTEVPSLLSQLCIAIIILAGSISFEVHQFELGHTLLVVAYVIVIALAARRFLKRKNTPPETFPLIGIGLLTGLAGSIVNALVAWDVLDIEWLVAGRRSLTEGMTLMLVLGVGGFLGPRLLGFERLPVVQMSGIQFEQKRNTLPVSRRTLYFAAGIVLVLTLVIEYEFGIVWMDFVRALVASLVMFTTLEPWRLPQVRTTLAWCVWTANLLTLIGLWLIAFFPLYHADALHIVFIGGFTLLILAVGMRVTLSHGGHGLEREKKSWPLRIGLITGCIAMLSRIGAPFSSGYTEHLAIAAVLWIAGLGFWGWKLIRLMWAKRM